jgi:hypothetical protein
MLVPSSEGDNMPSEITRATPDRDSGPGREGSDVTIEGEVIFTPPDYGVSWWPDKATTVEAA